jgi:Xaa-Pro aminopeptidase
MASCCLKVRLPINWKNTDREQLSSDLNYIVLMPNRELERFKGLSFDTISSTGPNAAIIHYKPSPTDSAIIKRDQVYLCDSGAQFLDGTTDVTRTFVRES